VSYTNGIRCIVTARLKQLLQSVETQVNGERVWQERIWPTCRGLGPWWRPRSRADHTASCSARPPVLRLAPRAATTSSSPLRACWRGLWPGYGGGQKAAPRVIESAKGGMLTRVSVVGVVTLFERRVG